MIAAIWLLLVMGKCYVHGEVFTSLAHLEQLVSSESDIADILDAYVVSETERLSTIQRFALDLRSHHKESSSDIDAYLSNPVNAYLTVKRFTSDWTKLVDTIDLIATNGKDAVNTIGDLHSVKPTSSDLKGAVNALLRLQDVYALSTEQIAAGNLGGGKGGSHSPSLTAEECFEIGRQAYNEEDYYHASMWIQYALEKRTLNDADQLILLDYLAFSTYQQGNIHHALNLTEAIIRLDPHHERAKKNIYFYNKEINEMNLSDKPTKIINERILDNYKKSDEFRDYEALCRDENIKPYKYQHKLSCRYLRSDPLFVLVPLKEEVMYLDPRLVVFHNFITDAEIAKVKELAKPKLKRATIQNPKTGVLETANYRLQRSTVFVIKDTDRLTQQNYRTSQSAWLHDHQHPLIKSISLKSAAASGLSLETVEELQVLNYGIGGHYEPHYDFARSFEKNSFTNQSGNRIATILFYMTDVEVGGSTAFISIGVNVKPRKGSCAMWYNLKRNGDGDMNTRHAACPVLIGQKWVCNKWFHERGQEFKRPCHLDSRI